MYVFFTDYWWNKVSILFIKKKLLLLLLSLLKWDESLLTYDQFTFQYHRLKVWWNKKY